MPAALCCGACCNLPCMLCYICHTVSCHAELCYAMLCYASCAFRVMLACCAMPCYACCALLCAMPCCTACCAVLCILYSAHAMPYHAIRHDAMPATSFKNPLVVNASSPPLETSHSIPAHKVMHTHTHRVQRDTSHSITSLIQSYSQRSCTYTQDAKAGTIPAEPLMQALLDQYLNRVSVNRATLKALFAAGDTDSDGLLDRPQAKGALLCALPSLSDTVLTAIWLEREKV